MRLLIAAALLLTVIGTAVFTGAETKSLTGFCIDGPEGGNCVTERVVDWDGPVLVPIVLGGLAVLALVVWLVRRALRWLTIAVVATGIAVAYAAYNTV